MLKLTGIFMWYRLSYAKNIYIWWHSEHSVTPDKELNILIY